MTPATQQQEAPAHSPNGAGITGPRKVRGKGKNAGARKAAAATARKQPAAAQPHRAPSAIRPTTIARASEGPPMLMTNLVQALPSAGTQLSQAQRKAFLAAFDANLGVCYSFAEAAV